MSKNINKAPSPFLVNPLKHHLIFIRKEIKKAANSEEKFAKLIEEVKQIAGTKTDLYIGSLPLLNIFAEVTEYLKNNKVHRFSEYKKWIASHDGFTEIYLSDDSKWILRIGNVESHYIHIHPARNSKNTKRININNLKTLILSALFYLKSGKFDIENINRIRKDYLELPEVKDSKNQRYYYENMMKYFL